MALGGESLTQTLKTKMGPAPVWVYGILVVIGVAWYLNKKGKGSGSGSGSSTGLPTEVVQGGGMPYTQMGDTFVNVTISDKDKDKHKKPPKHHKPPRGRDPFGGLNIHKRYASKGGFWEWESRKWEMKEEPKSFPHNNHRPVPKQHTKASNRG